MTKHEELPPARIHDTAEVSAEAHIGDGSLIWHYVQIRERASLGTRCIVGKGAYIDFDVTIGDNCKIQNGAYVYYPATLEDGVFLGPAVVLTNDKLPRAINVDGSPKSGSDWHPEGATIKTGAAVGARSVILPGITIGKWAMVGAGSVVTKDVPDYGLVLGNPARLVGYVSPAGHRMEEIAEGHYRCPVTQFELTRGKE